jgi:sRNA-binding protein
MVEQISPAAEATAQPPAPATTPPSAAPATPRAKQRRRPRQPQPDAAGVKTSPETAGKAAAAAPRAPPPVLEQLAGLYPQLFGANFLPLKRGIFQDLMAAHPELFSTDALKAALAFHTRSTRYLTVVAEGRQRHDLQGQPVEAMAPEHVYHALQEVFRRRQQRAPQEDLTPKLVRRIVQAFDAAGLSREGYLEQVRGKDDKANAALDAAMAQVAERQARDEALLRAFDAGSHTVEAFADMYGMDPRATAQALDRARLAKAG